MLEITWTNIFLQVTSRNKAADLLGVWLHGVGAIPGDVLESHGGGQGQLGVGQGGGDDGRDVGQEVGVHGQPVTEPANTVQSRGDNPRVVMERNDRELGQEHRQQRVGFLLLTVRQRLRHGVPGVKTRLQRRPGRGVHQTRLDGMIKMLKQRM